ncbi:MAG: PRC-barrel domain-containing protein [Jannaschia sp.]
MFKSSFLTATAATCLLATSALAQTATAPAPEADTTGTMSQSTDGAMSDTGTTPPVATETESAIETDMADTTSGMDGMSPFSMTSSATGDYMASTLIGMRLYVTETEMDPMTPVPAGSATEWDDVGEIGDMVIGSDGQLHAIVLDIGGFLGLGERQVAVDWSALRAVREDDDPDEIFWTVNATADALENAPEFDADTTITN